MLQKQRTYRGHLTLGNLTEEELRWWMENMKFCNSKKILQQELHMIKQLDASTKDWGHIAKNF